MDTSAISTGDRSVNQADRPRDLKQAAEAFEGMFLAQLLKTARAAGTSESETEGANGTVVEMAQEHLATEIAKGRGCGFAQAILKQMEQKSGAEAVVQLGDVR